MTVVTNETQDELKDSVGMMVVLVSLGMFFATIFFGYAVYRFSAVEVWPPMGMEKMALGLPSFTTFAVFLGSFFYSKSFGRYQINNKKEAKKFLILCILTGIAYGVGQFLLWRSMRQLGLYATTGIFASLIYAFTWVHAAHMLVALLLLFWTYFKVLPSNTEKRNMRHFKNVGTFWHFLTGVWFFIFVFLFLL